MKLSQIPKLLMALMLVMGAASAARADSVFNFEGDAVGTTTQFSNTNNGLTATFSSAADPGGFQVFEALGFVTLTGNFLAQGDSAPLSTALQISFGTDINNISMNFGLVNTDTFILDAYEGSTLVGVVSVLATASPNTGLAEGVISFGGKTFNSVVLNSSSQEGFGIDNVTVKSVSVPEPGTLLLVGLGLAGLAFLGRGRNPRAGHSLVRQQLSI